MTDQANGNEIAERKQPKWDLCDFEHELKHDIMQVAWDTVVEYDEQGNCNVIQMTPEEAPANPVRQKPPTSK